MYLTLVSINEFSFLSCLIVNVTHFYLFYSVFHFPTVKAGYKTFRLHRYIVIFIIVDVGINERRGKRLENKYFYEVSHLIPLLVFLFIIIFCFFSFMLVTTN